MRTRFLTLALALFATFALAAAQDARTILDRTASRLSGQGGLQAEFSMTSYVGSKVAGTASGTIYVQGNKFKLVSSQMQTWFDGKTQWSLMAGNGEVYVSNPTAAELQSVNPYYFLNLYKSGYNFQLVANYTPYSVRVKQKNGNWTRIRVSKLTTGKQWAASFFQFNPKDFPNVEVVDLR